MERFYSYKLGSYSSREYVLTVSGEPGLESFHELDLFAVIIHYSSEDGTEVQVARIDQAHGFTHFDKLFRPDEPKEPFDGGVDEAEEMLKNNWRRYAERYEENRK